MPETIYIPLGLRCSCAFVLKNQMKVRKYSLPFDWIDLSPRAIKNLIEMPQDNIEGFVSHYLDGVERQKHKEYGTYFPHHFVDNCDIGELKKTFTRRFTRLFELLNSGNDCVFLTLFPYTDMQTVSDYHNLIGKVEGLTKGYCYFISINLGHRMYSDHIDLSVPFNGEWSDFEIAIGEELHKNEFTKQLFNV